MVKILQFSISILLLSILAMSNAFAIAEAEGKVTDTLDTNLRGVKVIAHSVHTYLGEYQIYDELTDSQGKYYFDYMWLGPDGTGETYVITFDKSGYVSVEDYVSIDFVDGTNEVDDMEMNKTSNSSVEGYVYDSEENTVEGVTVFMKSNETMTNATTESDEDGFYKIENLQMGEYKLIAQSDEGTFVRTVELNANENKRYDIDLSEGLPDLIVRDIDVSPSSPDVGDDIEIDFTIKNQGEGDSASFKVQIYDEEELIETYVFSGLEAGESESEEFEYSFYEAGTREIKAIVDVDEEVDEEDETNNEYSMEVEIESGGVGSYLNLDCDFDTDTSGYTEVRVKAGYREHGGFYCYKTKVNMTIKGKTYEMYKQYDCDFVYLIRLPKGTYKFEFEASYPFSDLKSRTCTARVGNQTKLDIIIDGLVNNSKVLPTGKVSIAAHALMGGEILREGNMTAVLKEKGKSTIIDKTNMTRQRFGSFAGELNIPDKETRYQITVTYETTGWKKSSYIYVNSSYEAKTSGLAHGINVNIFSPSKYEYERGENMTISAKVIDSVGFTIKDANVTVTIFRSGKEVAEEKLRLVRYSYELPYDFLIQGNYKIVIEAITQEGMKAYEEKEFVIGQSSPVGIDQGDLRVSIITPKSDVYPENSSLSILTKITYKGDAVNNATNVKAIFMGQIIPLKYYRFGEYSGILPPLENGEYELTVKAENGEEMARNKVGFLISENFLNVIVLNPRNDTQLNISDGDRILINIDVLDIKKDIAVGAQVIIHVTEPTGRKHEMQAFQNPDTGEYSTVFYPNDNGVYHITVTASKIGYISDVTETQFIVMLKEDTWIAGMTWSTLLTVILVVGIIILVAAILRGVLF